MPAYGTPLEGPFLKRKIFRTLPSPLLSATPSFRRTLSSILTSRKRAGRHSLASASQEWHPRPIDVPDDGQEASTSSRCEDRGGGLIEGEDFSDHLMAAAPLAALSLKDIGKTCKNFYDRIYFGSGEFLPIVGTMRMSYGRLVQLLGEKKVKRIFLMADGQVAIVEVPFETHASDYKKEVKYDKNDTGAVYLDQKPEWQMEKMRYYCELPGDVWEDGTFMKLVKRNQYHHTEKGRVKYEWLLREHQVTTELVVMDPNDAFVFLNDQMSQLVPILGLFVLRGFVGVSDWAIGKFFKKKKDEMAQLAEEYARPRAIEFNVGEDGVRNDTGVRFEDVAGIDRVKADIIEVIKMMRGDKTYRGMGAKPPRGILLEGPPGTGKTYLAKAMAGEGGMPFYSCNGAEFVEMFSGVAAARIRNIFKTAREKAPSIIFIDEIDAIGKRRGSSGGSGSTEREAGLMQLLVEMDGVVKGDQVVVIGATNRISLLDPALLRPGRFDRIIYMGRPSESNRLKILKVHAKNKLIGDSDERTENEQDDKVLKETARMTLGYSGADLANLLNEAAILSIREANFQAGDVPPKIGLKLIQSAMEKARVGLPQKKLPDSKAKKFLATVQAGKVVALALTPGIPRIQALSIRPQGNTIGRILFEPMEYGHEGDMWHGLSYPGGEANAVNLEEPLGTFDLCCGLLVPLYAGRVTEEVLFGSDSVTLSTARDVARASDLAYYLVTQSNLHPAFRQIPVSMRMRAVDDSTVRGTAEWFERHIAQMQEIGYKRTRRLIEEHAPAIKKVAELLCTRDEEIVYGKEVIQILKETPCAEAETRVHSYDYDSILLESSSSTNGNGSRVIVSDSPSLLNAGSEAFVTFNSGRGNVGGFWAERPVNAAEDMKNFVISQEDAKNAMEAAIGKADILDFLGDDVSSAHVEQMKAVIENSAVTNRLKAVRKYSTEADSGFPPPPVLHKDGKRPSFKNAMVSEDLDPQDFKDDMEYWGSRFKR